MDGSFLNVLHKYGQEKSMHHVKVETKNIRLVSKCSAHKRSGNISILYIYIYLMLHLSQQDINLSCLDIVFV